MMDWAAVILVCAVCFPMPCLKVFLVIVHPFVQEWEYEPECPIPVVTVIGSYMNTRPQQNQSELLSWLTVLMTPWIYLSLTKTHFILPRYRSQNFPFAQTDLSWIAVPCFWNNSDWNESTLEQSLENVVPG